MTKTTLPIICKKIDEIRDEVKEHNKKLDAIAVDLAIVKTEMKNHLGHHEKAETKSYRGWMIAIGIVAIICSIITGLILKFV